MRASRPAPPSSTLVRSRLVISGIVQGVGFRPFIHRLAGRYHLNGWVLNSTQGVVIEVEGVEDAVDRFVRSIPQEAPPRASVERIERTSLPPIGYRSFAIEPSQEPEGHFSLISPDICICGDCLREMRDPGNRRYRYPFINCTNCGPRLTIVKDVPYDRPKTAMACFPMCPECEAEYHDPANRRFHAQPNACPTCGPRLWLVVRADGETGGRGDRETGRVSLPEGSSTGDADSEGSEAIEEARRLLAGGTILAIKGLGGFHLACDATKGSAVAELRRRKHRSDKPFAVMALDAEAVDSFCYVSEEERQLLESPMRPIVLLRRREHSRVSDAVAPGNSFLGVMLPYTPLHYLLLEPSVIGDQSSGLRTQNSELRAPIAARREPRPPALSTQNPEPGTQNSPQSPVLVMTSGNLSEEPIATGNREALTKLDSLADAWLLHDRDIELRCDDSVTRVFRGKEAVIRRSRGYAPFPVRLRSEAQDLLACGGQLKNTFCITKKSYAFLSQHIGDLENAETLTSFATSVEHFRKLFRLEVTAIAHDLHPEYLSTRYAWEQAEQTGLPLVPVQHHHAHIAACMAENGVDVPVLGVAFDGTGYGEDGHIWGGEFLVGDFAGFRRAAHLKYVRLPSGEGAVHRPYRMAASYLADAFGPDALDRDLFPRHLAEPAEMSVLRKQIAGRIDSPLTSSAGRLFDAVSSLLDVRHVVNYEGQAAIELEMIAHEDAEGTYPWDLLPGEPRVIDVAPTIRQIIEERRQGTPIQVISSRFHNTVAALIAGTCTMMREETGIDLVALSGGVFQNQLLLERACRLLEASGFRVLSHHQVPTNDGGIALGQAVIANRVLGDRG